MIPGSRASWITDIIAIAVIGVLVAQIFSYLAVAKWRKFELHRFLQKVLVGSLFGALLIFEWEMRTFGWQDRARPSPYFDTLVYPALYVHLVFAISTFLLWAVVFVQAMRNFPKTNLAQAPFRARHRRLAKPATWGLAATVITGWVFYILAFLA